MVALKLIKVSDSWFALTFEVWGRFSTWITSSNETTVWRKSNCTRWVILHLFVTSNHRIRFCVLFLEFRPPKHRKVPQLVHRQQAERAIHRCRVGRERRSQTRNKKGYGGRNLLPRKAHCWVHSLDSKCSRAHALKANYAPWFKACEHFYRQHWRFKSGRPRTK